MSSVSASTTGEIQVTRSGSVATVVLADPARHNAVSVKMWIELRRAIERLSVDPALRVLLIRGHGDEAFSSGANIAEFSEHRSNRQVVERYDRVVAKAEAAIIACGVPTLAMIHGTCIGGGALIALACAMRFADTDLRFAIPASRLGTVYPATTIARLVHLVGPSVAFDLTASARVVGAKEASRIGLVNVLTARGNLEAAVMQYADELCARAPLSVRAAQLAVRAAYDRTDREAGDALRKIQRAASESDDYLEGIEAFMQKRPPRFSGR